MESCRKTWPVGSVLPVLPIVLAVLLCALPPLPAAGQEAEPAAAPSGPAAADAAWRFAVAKALAAEGSLAEAAAELAEVVRLVPDDPFVRLEYAGLLTDLASEAPSSRLSGEHLAEALEQAEAALALDPENLEAWRVVAQARLALARDDSQALAGAVEALEKVHAGDPSDYRSAMILAQIHLEGGEPERAAEVLERLAAEVPSHPQVEGLLIRAYLAAGRQPEAESALHRLLAADPDRLDVRLDAASLASERGDHEAALALLRQAPAEAAARPTLARREALELYFLDRFDEALARIESLPDDAADASVDGLEALIYAAQGRHVDFAGTLETLALDLGVHSELARMLEERGAAAQAEEVLRTLLARLEAGEEPVGAAAGRLTIPAAVLVRDELASLQARLERPADAAATLEPLLDHTQEAVASGARLRSAAFLHEAGETAAALALLAGEEGPDADLIALDAHLARGEARPAARLLRRLGRSDEPGTALRAAAVAQRHERWDLALPILEALVERDPAPQALFNLGAAYERSGRIPEAVNTFRRLLAAHPDYDEALNYLGYLWADRGENLDEALGLIRRAVAAEPDNGAYVDSLGWVHHRLGEHRLALDYLERAARLLPDDPEVQEHLGDVLHRLGDARRAREHWQRALELGGGDDAELARKVEELAVD
jgi:tetratricopeptide (TPR) repeat protein